MRGVMIDDEGYTLAEALTALLIVALAMAGLAQAAHVIGGQARATGQVRDRVSDLARLQRLVASAPPNLGPFFVGGERFTGAPTQAVFDCDEPQPCSLVLARDRLMVRWREQSASAPTGASSAQLRYIDDLGAVQDHWPSGMSGRRLAAVAVIAGQTPLAIMRLAPTTSGACLARAVSSECGPRIGSDDVQPR